ncbi:glycerate kinase type-2 family protein [Paratissierella segnis]|uniref:Glycerate kinase n=1 Tax=Paratissierella segnis TaxID=2763679 RepID=A0A926IEC7_9FIRM|nr:glycerate kinase [Paratissierella segnis]MBC8587232.1 glycerate kinase [Paratissierella segnis]
MNLRYDAQRIIEAAITAALPNTAIKKALDGEDFSCDRLILVSIGKAAWSMAHAAYDILGDKINEGIVITKYNHSKGNLPNIHIYEAGHPIPDKNSFLATEQVINLVSDLSENDKVLLLISGGGSALFEKPLIAPDMLEDITKQLLACGANIVEMNTIRKRLSAVKGGKFAKLCEPAQIISVVLSDIIGDPLDMIASGPAYPDSSTGEQALEIIARYGIKISEEIKDLLLMKTPDKLNNVKTKITGSVSQLCYAAERACIDLGYEPIILTNSLSCEAREAGSFLASIAQYYNDTKKSLAFILGGETIVHLKGNGKGGRNQELALCSAIGIAGLDDVAIFSIGSDGTDGPTDAAGGYVDNHTYKILLDSGIDIYKVLENNDAYHGLKACDGLIITGPTGTNVNDFSVLLIKR